MPKPPTAERGRRPRPAFPPPAPHRPSLRERMAARRAEGAPEDGGDEVFDAGAEGRHWRAVVTPLLCVLALGISIYLTYTHFTDTAPGLCSDSGAINCLKVTTSAESYVFGIPVAVLGLVFYVPMLALCLPAAWRSTNRYVAPARLAAAVSGIGFACYLVYCELYEIHAICLWCTTVHSLTFLLFVSIITGWDQARAPARAASEALA